MSQVAAALFFLGLLAVLAVILQHSVSQYWAEIVAALRGELPPRMKVKATARPSVPSTRLRPRTHAAA